MTAKFPIPRPTEPQFHTIRNYCLQKNIDMPNLEYMTKGSAGKWIRENILEPKKKQVISKVTIITYSTGEVEMQVHK